MAASNIYTLYTSGATSVATTAGSKITLPISGSFQVVEWGLRSEATTGATVMNLSYIDGAGSTVTIASATTAGGATNGKVTRRIADVLIDTVTNSFTLNGVTTVVAAGITAVNITTTGAGTGNGVYYIKGCLAGDLAAPTAVVNVTS